MRIEGKCTVKKVKIKKVKIYPGVVGEEFVWHDDRIPHHPSIHHGVDWFHLCRARGAGVSKSGAGAGPSALDSRLQEASWRETL